MEKIFVLGKVLWDVILKTEAKLHRGKFYFAFKEKTIVGAMLQEPGGGAVNVSLGLKKLGYEPLPVGLVGRDFLGEEIRDYLRQNEVLSHLIGNTKGATGTSVIIMGKNGLHTAFVYPGANKYLSARDIDFAEAKKARWWLVLSWGNVEEKVIKRLVEQKQKLGKYLAFNPGIIQLGEKSKIRPLLAITDILIVNEKELYLVLGKKLPLKEALVAAVSLGPKIVVVTLGAQGSIVYDGGHFYRAPVYPAKVVDSLGCGDAYSSAFLGWFMRTGKIEEAILAGTINSASVVAEKGALAGQLDAKSLAKKIKEAEIEVKKEKVEEALKEKA